MVRWESLPVSKIEYDILYGTYQYSVQCLCRFPFGTDKVAESCGDDDERSTPRYIPVFQETPYSRLYDFF